VVDPQSESVCLDGQPHIQTAVGWDIDGKLCGWHRLNWCVLLRKGHRETSVSHGVGHLGCCNL